MVNDTVVRTPAHRPWKFWGRKRGRAARRHVRHECTCTGVLRILNSAHVMEGLVNEISFSGLRFRPAKSFILERNGAQVSCSFADMQLTGKIVATRSSGFGIALHEDIDEETLDDFVSKHGSIDQG